MLSYKFDYELRGPVFNNPTGATKKAITQALATTANQGRKGVKAITRVDTGRLKRNWYTAEVSWNDFILGNPTPYASVWEGRDQVLASQLLNIQVWLNQNLDEELERELN